jgi:SAM-dependent methyltransferase
MPSDYKKSNKPAVRHEYEQHGVRGFYENYGATYRNPHEQAIRATIRQIVEQWKLDVSHVLDLACGSGEVTLALQELGCVDIEGVDPYTAHAYHERTGKYAEPYTFEQIAAGALSGRNYSLIVCSFALHLLEESRLPGLLAQLALLSDTLLILTPHKRPEIKESWGWVQTKELVVERVRARLYRSEN